MHISYNDKRKGLYEEFYKKFAECLWQNINFNFRGALFCFSALILHILSLNLTRLNGTRVAHIVVYSGTSWRFADNYRSNKFNFGKIKQ
jgi:hypothetical protein